MAQQYHSNAKTNIHFRGEISNSGQARKELSVKYSVSKPTIAKWQGRSDFCDKSSRPHTIHYSLDELQKGLIKSIRTALWASAMDIFDLLIEQFPQISLSSISRELVLQGINKKPVEQKEKSKKFKEYEPGFLHIDVTYLPKLDGIKYYLYVAIDRATRAMVYKVYEAKTAENTDDFCGLVKAYFPFKITHILTDNGLEFTNRLIVSKKGAPCKKASLLDKFCEEEKIEHRHTKPYTPQTNGMVEKVNDTIKNATILKETYSDHQEMRKELKVFLMFYIVSRRHGGLRKDMKNINVRTPFDAMKVWYKLKPELFHKTPEEFLESLNDLVI